jgi:hypothetical protein
MHFKSPGKKISLYKGKSPIFTGFTTHTTTITNIALTTTITQIQNMNFKLNMNDINIVLV